MQPPTILAFWEWPDGMAALLTPSPQAAQHTQPAAAHMHRSPQPWPAHAAHLLHLQLVVKDILDRHRHLANHGAADRRPLQANSRGASLHSRRLTGGTVDCKLWRRWRRRCLFTTCLTGRSGRRRGRGRRRRPGRGCWCRRQGRNARLPGTWTRIVWRHHAAIKSKVDRGGSFCLGRNAPEGLQEVAQVCIVATAVRIMAGTRNEGKGRLMSMAGRVARELAGHWFSKAVPPLLNALVLQICPLKVAGRAAAARPPPWPRPTC